LKRIDGKRELKFLVIADRLKHYKIDRLEFEKRLPPLKKGVTENENIASDK